MADKSVRIGCSSGFWGDSSLAARQLVESGEIDYLIGDYLAEVTMSILVRAKAKNPAMGYAPDFVQTIIPLLKTVSERNIKIVVNAGGINPAGARDALDAAAKEQGLEFKIAIVEGDDLLDQAEGVRAAGTTEMFSARAFPEKPLSMNAYLGARPIARALDAGAQIVITGRCADSAMALGPLMHEFGWTDSEYDKLASGSLVGHVLECGAQCTGGLFTDWDQVPDWETIGYPIARCEASGDFTVTKPQGTGGLVSRGTVAEQILYEIGDPAAYLLPDVVCDFTEVVIEETGKDEVRVSNVKGHPPTPYYKVSATHMEGYRVLTTLMIAGHDADAKARRTGRAILARCAKWAEENGFPPFRETSVEVLGAEDSYGANRRIESAREVILKIAARHDRKEPLEFFSREVAPAATSMAQGTTGFFGGRPNVTPVVRLFSFLREKTDVPVHVSVGGERIAVDIHEGRPFRPNAPAAAEPAAERSTESGSYLEVPLRRLAYARSGDKGNHANIGIIARKPEFYEPIKAALSDKVVARFFEHWLEGPVTRFELPGFHALNFLLEDVLGGGGTASLRYDPQGKGYGQMLLDLRIRVPSGLLDGIETSHYAQSA